MAQALSDHWKQVFQPSGCNEGLLREWFSKLFPQVSPGVWDTRMLDKMHVSWKVLKKHVRQAIKFAKCSMPGPDGIPAQAYKALGPLAVDVLYNVFETLSGASILLDLLFPLLHHHLQVPDPGILRRPELSLHLVLQLGNGDLLLAASPLDADFKQIGRYALAEN